VKAIYRHDQTRVENTLIRNRYISREHIAIVVEEENTLAEENTQREIIRRKKCVVEDLASTHGTEVNGTPLRPRSLVELRHGHTVVLGPRTPLPLVITLKERLQRD